MENKLTLFNLSAEMAEIENALIDNGGELTPELEKALTFTQEALTRKADDYGAVLQKFTALSEACKAEIDRINAIKKTADNSVKNIKERLAWTMDNFQMAKLEGSLHKFSLVKTTSTETDDDLLLAPYRELIAALQERLPAYITVKASISKAELKDTYKDKDVRPEGVTFVENKSIRIK